MIYAVSGGKVFEYCDGEIDTAQVIAEIGDLDSRYARARDTLADEFPERVYELSDLCYLGEEAVQCMESLEKVTGEGFLDFSLDFANIPTTDMLIARHALDAVRETMEPYACDCGEYHLEELPYDPQTLVENIARVMSRVPLMEKWGLWEEHDMQPAENLPLMMEDMFALSGVEQAEHFHRVFKHYVTDRYVRVDLNVTYTG